jgi:hypothetical protein
MVAFAYFLNFEQGNNCFYGVVIPDSALYLEDSRLVKIPKHVPAAFPLPSALKIPPVLFQTNERDEVPAAMYATIVSNIETNGDFDFRFFDRDDRREFMKQMGERYEKAYDALAPGAYKADLWRYTAVYKHGGCYMDAGSFTTKPFSEFLKATDEFVSSYDCKGHCLNSAFFCGGQRQQSVGVHAGNRAGRDLGPILRPQRTRHNGPVQVHRRAAEVRQRPAAEGRTGRLRRRTAVLFAGDYRAVPDRDHRAERGGVCPVEVPRLRRGHAVVHQKRQVRRHVEQTRRLP